jgi:hypothetical protein
MVSTSITPLMLAPPADIALEGKAAPALDPTAAEDRVVLRMGGVHEQDSIALAFVFLN